ncbi:uncharacterized protein CDV56_103687 [Aspergillus thermomutatus]|uniref:Uncharacterized protein n=1 Tax=Aspergillus thermomutatus TaxID=41047 RepID=A0A397HYH7_ASPTH|nr:uncharacterized protein CDV56_103687 [Aspergillus thermomutatus]RHZ68275.1 hypothetical protein CDV56_103687 [Aspergillus thermomutatus]
MEGGQLFSVDDRTVDSLADAVVLDAISALHSFLASPADKVPLGQFFYEEAEVETRGGLGVTTQGVGLVAFTSVK